MIWFALRFMGHLTMPQVSIAVGACLFQQCSWIITSRGPAELRYSSPRTISPWTGRSDRTSPSKRHVIQNSATYHILLSKTKPPHLGMSLSVATGVAGLSSRVGLSLSVVHLAQTLVAGEDLLIAHNVDPEVGHAREELHLVPGVDTAGSL